ncbi:hypothetical protein AB9F39_38440, partial [Rhizobium leguminosarum]
SDRRRNLEACIPAPHDCAGQTEAVRTGAGIGILHDYIARQYQELRRILPEVSIRRAYWTNYHETARDLLRVRSVADFVQ